MKNETLVCRKRRALSGEDEVWKMDGGRKASVDEQPIKSMERKLEEEEPEGETQPSSPP